MMANLCRLAVYLGLPPPLCLPQQAKILEQSRRFAAGRLTVADRAAAKVVDILCSAQVHLDTIEDTSSHFSMTQTYESQLDALRMQYQEGWSWNLEVQLLAAKMYIFGITLTLDLPHDEYQLSQAFLYRQITLEKGMKAASSFVSTMADLSNQSIPGHRYASGILTFYPKHFFTSLMAAAAYLFRFLLAYQGATLAQQSLAISRITEAHKIFQSFPDHRDAMRACINIEIFVDAVRANPGHSDPPTIELAVKNRLGASVVHDALFRAAQHRNWDPTNGSSLPVAQWSTMNENSCHRLPLAPEQRVVSPRSQLWVGNIGSSDGLEQQDNTASWLGVWDTYFNEFGVMNEPWVQQDAEFGLPAQPLFPPVPDANDHVQPMTSTGS